MFRRSTRSRGTLTAAPTEYGHVVLDESRGQYWHLNDSALLVAECLRGGGDRTRAAQALVDRYGIPEDQALHDVDSARDELVKVGLL